MPMSGAGIRSSEGLAADSPNPTRLTLSNVTFSGMVAVCELTGDDGSEIQECKRNGESGTKSGQQMAAGSARRQGPLQYEQCRR
jgi:hypothetical protein